MKTKKKNGFITFCLSLLPGMAHMYMGFFKMGLSLMSLFFAIIAVTATFNLPMLSFAFIIVWAYSFFHSHNIASLNDEDFSKFNDHYFFGLDNVANSQLNSAKYRKYFGIGLIVCGILMLWNTAIDILIPILRLSLPHDIYNILSRIISTVPTLFFSILVFYFGIKMLRGKNKPLAGEGQSKSEVDDGK